MATRDPHRLGPAIVVAASALAACGLVVAMVLGFQDRVLVPLAWSIVAAAVVFAVAARMLGSVKRRALGVERLIGAPAFAARLAPTTGGSGLGGAVDGVQAMYAATDQLQAVDGYASPMHPILAARGGMLEFWRDADQAEPYAVVPLSLVRARLAPDRGWFRAAALQIEVEGMRLPMAFSFYRSGWAAVLPADGLELEEMASELGIRPVDSDDDRPL